MSRASVDIGSDRAGRLLAAALGYAGRGGPLVRTGSGG